MYGYQTIAWCIGVWPIAMLNDQLLFNMKYVCVTLINNQFLEDTCNNHHNTGQP
jgi:hypothetical protein